MRRGVCSTTVDTLDGMDGNSVPSALFSYPRFTAANTYNRQYRVMEERQGPFCFRTRGLTLTRVSASSTSRMIESLRPSRSVITTVCLGEEEEEEKKKKKKKKEKNSTVGSVVVVVGAVALTSSTRIVNAVLKLHPVQAGAH